MVYYKLVKVTINTLGLLEVIIIVVVRHYSLPDSIVTNQRLLFTSKFWLLLYYFLAIKWRLFTAFYLQMDSQTKRQNSITEAYLRVFVNLSKIIRHGFFSWRSLPTTMSKMPILTIYFWSSIADITLGFLTKKT